jgi:hypothetical protein
MATTKASMTEVWLDPFVRDLDILIPGYVFFFALQISLKFVANRVFPKFRALPEKEKVDWAVRGVAAINGLICQRSTYLWLSFLYNMPSGYKYDLYTPLPGYRESLALLVAYFMWDVTVCFYYRWSWAYTLHGICSGIGMYLCSYPCSALWSPYYAGVFELSNFFYHGGTMFRLVTDQSPSAPTVNKIVPLFGEAFFVVWFFAVRLFGGIWTSTRWIWLMGTTIYAGQAHNDVAAGVMIALFTGVISVQVLWAKEVYQGVIASLKKVD